MIQETNKNSRIQFLVTGSLIVVIYGFDRRGLCLGRCWGNPRHPYPELRLNMT